MAKQISDDTKFVGNRLPSNIKPKHYDICLKPNFEDFTFTGTVKIEYEITNAGDAPKAITLHAAELKISEGWLGSEKNALTTVTYSNTSETATLEFQGDLLPCGVLCLNFSGLLNDKLRGFYRSSFNVGNETVYIAVTQLAATEARRCFPCWDEPALKATFSVGLTINKNMTIGDKQYERLALSNMPEVSREGPDSEMTIKFDRSPIMSTYLVAFAVGPFEVIETLNKDRPVRVYTRPGNKEHGQYALDMASKSLTFYENYFGIDYPLPKMDLIAVPDFAFGAMENWGLIVYREARLLVDDKNTSTSFKQAVALVVAHEIAHQWFGNLVTMEWWTHLWLNEGFAKFMEYLCTHHIHPEYDLLSQFIIRDLSRAFDLDALHNSHPIEVPINHHSEINEIFDAISYSKGASVIKMMHGYIGDADFRKGMKDYLSKFAYSNACTEDLWDALGRASNKPIRELMSGWTSQKGYPLLTFEHSQESDDMTKLRITQRQFTLDGKLFEDEQKATWHVPIIALAGDNRAGSLNELCLLKGKTTELQYRCPRGNWLKLNADFSGLYRVAYPPEMRAKLYPAIASKTLSSKDRLNMLDDLYALCQAGLASTKDLLELLQAFDREDDYTVWASIDKAVGKLKLLIGDSELRDKFNNFCRKLYSNIYESLKWDRQSPNEINEGMMRAIVIKRLLASDHSSAIEEAKLRFRRHLSESGPRIEPDLRAPVYGAIATHESDELFEKLFEIYRTTDLSEEKLRLAMGLASTRDASRLEKVIKFILSPEVKSQDKVIALMPIGSGNPEAAFKILKDNKEFLRNEYQGGLLMSRLIQTSVEDFTSYEKAKEVEVFFNENKFVGAERTIQQVIETIKSNASWLARDKEAIENFLSNY